MTEASAQAPPSVLHPIQLVEVHCASVSAERKTKDEAKKPEDGNISLGVTPLDASRRAFRARLDIDLTPPGQTEDDVAELHVVVQGTFTSEADISDDLFARFIEFTPIVLLWPYARAYIAQAGQMVGLNVPPLPSLDTFGLVQQSDTEAEA